MDALSRRQVLHSLLAAPFVVRSGVLMPLRGVVLNGWRWGPSLYYPTLNMITREAVKLFKVSSPFMQALERADLWDRPCKIGSTLRIRMPQNG